MKALKGVIFDLDGTLVEQTLDFSRIKEEMGLENHQPILTTMANMEAPRKKRCLEILDAHETKSAVESTLIPGAKELLMKLGTLGLERGIFTLNCRKSVDLILNRHALNVFSQIMTREDAPIKPDPAGLRIICGKWGINADECLFIGNHLNDLLAGMACGMRTVLFAPAPPPAHWPRAAHTVDDFHLFTESFETLFR